MQFQMMQQQQQQQQQQPPLIPVPVPPAPNKPPPPIPNSFSQGGQKFTSKVKKYLPTNITKFYLLQWI